ncbi:hypothetical protein G7046_g4586 [Stylonectria norvegica]|nr:hypothetical protein G7046_g4586 [Stylonectria norvegica]
MASSSLNKYWIPHLDIHKKIITQELQCFLGPQATVRPYTFEASSPPREVWWFMRGNTKPDSASSDKLPAGTIRAQPVRVKLNTAQSILLSWWHPRSVWSPNWLASCDSWLDTTHLVHSIQGFWPRALDWGHVNGRYKRDMTRIASWIRPRETIPRIVISCRGGGLPLFPCLLGMNEFTGQVKCDEKLLLDDTAVVSRGKKITDISMSHFETILGASSSSKPDVQQQSAVTAFTEGLLVFFVHLTKRALEPSCIPFMHCVDWSNASTLEDSHHRNRIRCLNVFTGSLSPKISLNTNTSEFKTATFKMTTEASPKFVYKIVPAPPPEPIPDQYPLSSLDQNDGFVHLSTAVQVPNTANLFYTVYPTIWVIKLRFSDFSASSKWEDGFPHLYGNFGAANVESVEKFDKVGNQSWAEILKASSWLV